MKKANTYLSINSLPKPETVAEFIKYFFASPSEYLKTTLITLLYRLR